MRAALAGNPIERAVAADALGAPDAPEASAPERAARLGVLLDVMRSDPYPAVRAIAWRAARRLAGAPDAPDAPWARYVPESRSAERARAADAIARALPAGAVRPLDPSRADALRADARALAIDIGE